MGDYNVIGLLWEFSQASSTTNSVPICIGIAALKSP